MIVVRPRAEAELPSTVMCVQYTRLLHMVRGPMRTNIVINDELMERAMKLAGLKSKRETVEAGLQLLVKLKQQERMRKLRGKLRWEGNLDEMRRDR